MITVKRLAMIFLAIYLIVSGLVTMTGFSMSFAGDALLQLIAIASGILILISVGKCCQCENNK